MDLKLGLLGLTILLLVPAMGCGEKASADSFQDAPNLDKRVTPEEAMKKRGMSDEEIAREKAAQRPGGVAGGR